MHALGTGGDMGASTEEGMVGSAVAALAIVTARTTSLGTATAFILIFMGGYSSTCPAMDCPRPLHWCDAGPPPPPAPVWYYCTDPQGYYPTVAECTVPWTPVAPSG